MTVKKNEIQVNDLAKVFTFNPSNQPIRVEVLNNEPWFIAKDLCDALDLRDTEVSLRKLEDDEKLTRKVYASGQNREMWFVNESGLYNLIFRSNKPEAKAFRKWVTSEVLPAIRQTGKYDSVKATPKELPSDEFYVNLYRSISVAGSQRRLSEYLRIAESVISDLFSRPQKSSRAMIYYIGECCRVIKESNALPSVLPVERPNMRRSAINNVELLADICRIDNGELRASLVAKVMGGRAL